MRRLMITIAAAGAVAGAAAYTAYHVAFRPWWRAWGVDEDERARVLPGDEVLADGVTLETRAITIDAPPEAVWPWLRQMGFGRAGWYSYDAIDMRGRSADDIVSDTPEPQLGDVFPTDPAGGFEVRAVEPGRLLVLYMDADLRRAQDAAAGARDAAPRNLQAAGTMLSVSQPAEFKATWSFVLAPLPGGRTRLIERVRGQFGPARASTRAMQQAMGFGVFVMIRRQLLGIRERAERLSSTTELVAAGSAPTIDEPVLVPGG